MVSRRLFTGNDYGLIRSYMNDEFSALGHAKLFERLLIHYRILGIYRFVGDNVELLE